MSSDADLSFNLSFHKVIPICFFFSLLWLLQPIETFSAGSSFDSTVLIYHRFGEDKYPTTNVSVEQFKEQMAYLAANNYQVISLIDLVDALNNRKKIPEKSVVITVDDGYMSTYLNAWPILKSYGYPFTVFINAKSIGSGFSNYMGWDEVVELHKDGVDIQDHSYAHGRLADRPEGMNDREYESWIRDDLNRNRRTISEKLGEEPRFLAIPYGEYNQQVMKVARSSGYEAILTQDPGSISELTDPHMIPREAILGDEWATISHFKYILRRVDLPISDLQPNYGNVGEAPLLYSARIVNPDRYLANSFGLYVSELGWIDAELEYDRVVAYGGVKLTRKLNRVMVKAKEKGTGGTAVRSWLLVRHKNN